MFPFFNKIKPQKLLLTIMLITANILQSNSLYSHSSNGETNAQSYTFLNDLGTTMHCNQIYNSELEPNYKIEIQQTDNDVYQLLVGTKKNIKGGDAPYTIDGLI